MYFFQNKDKTMIPQRYLKSWGNDYPYLSENKNNMQRWLPIPENSEAQRLIRNINGDSEFWIRGNDFIMGPINRSGTLPSKVIMYS
jgi:hypothetical protein